MKIRVRSIPDKFMRAGMAFTKKSAEYDVDEKTLQVLQAEKMLVVEELPVVETQTFASLQADDKPKAKGGGKG